MEPNVNHNGDPTRERLLDEAERLFARKGYAAVTVRQITSAAGTNLAAVNYHFGNKHNLYMEVFRTRWLDRAVRVRQPLEDLAKKENITLEEVVHTLANAFLRGPLTREERELHTKLIGREMENPSEAFEVLAEGAIKPMLRLGCSLLQRALPHPVSEDKLRLFALSLFSQTIYFNFARPVVSMATGREYTSEFVNEIINHITSFALHGMEGMES